MTVSAPAKTILIVEDEQSLRNAQKLAFKNEGYEVLEAVNGKIGLEMALSRHPDVIVLDIIMPEMDGIGFLKNLREDDWGFDAKVVLFTNGDDAQTLPDSIRMGVHNYLIKSETSLQEIVKIVKGELK